MGYNMNINVLKIALIFCGTVIGAGFASGQEILKFFSVYGVWGLWGVALAGGLFAVMACTVLTKVYKNNILNYDEYIMQLFGGRVGIIIKAIVTLFMFCTFCAMLSGAGAVIYQQFGIAKDYGIMIMVIVVLIVLLFDIRGLVGINIVLTPIMILGIAIIGIYIIITSNYSAFSIKSAILDVSNNWFTSAIIYVSYNMLTGIVILVSLKKLVDSRRTALLAGMLSGELLLILAIIMWAAIHIYYLEVLPFEIPFLKLSAKAGEIMQGLYTFILFSAIFTAAVSCGYGLTERISNALNVTKYPIVLALCGLSIPCAYFGFANFVGELYAVFGYLGLFIMLAIICDGVKCVLKH